MTQLENPWVIGFGVNLINDSGGGVSGIFNFEDNYHFQNPISLSLEKRFADHFGFQVSGHFNRYVEGKVVDGETLDEDISFLAIDAGLKYYITNQWLNPYRAIYEGYFIAGPGITFYDSEENYQIFGGAGINWFLSEEWRLNTQAVAKLGVRDGNNNGSNYLQFNIGLIYRFTTSGRCGC